MSTAADTDHSGSARRLRAEKLSPETVQTLMDLGCSQRMNRLAGVEDCAKKTVILKHASNRTLINTFDEASTKLMNFSDIPQWREE